LRVIISGIEDMVILSFTAIFMPKPAEKMINTKDGWMNNIVRRKIAGENK